MKFTLPLLATASVLALTGASAYRLQDRTALAKTEQSGKFQQAPELVGGPWLNTGGKSLTLASRRGKVTVVEFWTFGCSNCRANLLTYARWDKQFEGKGVKIIGVHTPEFESESKLENVKAQVKQLGIRYPVLLDNQKRNWNNWRQEAWPTVYVIDKNGRIRARWKGELEAGGANMTAKLTATIEKLLAENGSETKNTMKNQDNSYSVTKTDAQWREELTPEQYKVLRQAGTEAPFTGALLQNHESGVYECGACGQALFNSDTKFDSGSGWPSFYDAIPGSVKEIQDVSFGMARTEIVCSRCGSHLGHVFDDGPQPTGLRYCTNSASLEFEKK